ncbi:MAG: hypothetical protein FWG52_09955 [Proteobacteria bacterium]|nr:hypothetical protein [Pseudomonadota bacterium]
MLRDEIIGGCILVASVAALALGFWVSHLFTGNIYVSIFLTVVFFMPAAAVVVTAIDAAVNLWHKAHGTVRPILLPQTCEHDADKEWKETKKMIKRMERDERRAARSAAARYDPLPLIGAALFGGWIASRRDKD